MLADPVAGTEVTATNGLLVSQSGGRYLTNADPPVDTARTTVTYGLARLNGELYVERSSGGAGTNDAVWSLEISGFVTEYRLHPRGPNFSEEDNTVTPQAVAVEAEIAQLSN